MAASVFAIPSPVHKLESVFPFQCYMKRDDLIHQEVSGNKYRKLKYLIQEAINHQKKGIITFGGPFSNHIYSTAAFTHLLGLPSVGIIRGEEDLNNPTINFAIENEMKIHFVSRLDYKIKNSETIMRILSTYPDYLVIPDGGYHPLALKGVNEILEELDFIPDFIACSIGTGATAAGLLMGIVQKGWKTKVLAFSSMKNKSLRDQIFVLANVSETKNLIMIEEYHGGGYAKLNPTLLSFHESFFTKTKITLDPIYTLKMMFGLDDMGHTNYFNANDTVLAYHSGGIQGWNGFEYLTRN